MSSLPAAMLQSAGRKWPHWMPPSRHRFSAPARNRVELSIHWVDNQQVPIAGAVALDVVQRLARSRNGADVLIPGERPILYRSVVGYRERSGIRVRGIQQDFHGHARLVRGHYHEIHIQVITETLVSAD